MQHKTMMSGLALAGTLAVGAALPVATHAETPPAPRLQDVRSEQVEADKAALASQQRIDNVDDETQKLLAEYRKALADAESHATYATQLEKQVASQHEELATIQTQLDEVEATSRSITPLLQRMLATLHQFVDLDVPFLVDERKQRVATLEEMMDRADVSISEKYRRIIEAYQVEMDYGRTIEAYEARLAGSDNLATGAAGDERTANGAAGDERTAKFLRVGRVSLLYQTLDGKETGYWDVAARKWVIDNDYAHAFKEGVAVAMKMRAPEMLLAPVPAPVEARS